MTWIDRFSIKVKLIGSFAIAASLLMVGTLVGILASQFVSSSLNSLLSRQGADSQRSFTVIANVARIQNVVQNLVADPSQYTAASAELLKLSNQIEDELQSAMQEDQGDAPAALYTDWSSYRFDLNRLVNTFNMVKGDQSNSAQLAYNRSWAQFLDSAILFQAANIEKAAGESRHSGQTLNQITIFLMAAGLLAIFFAVWVGIFLSRNINRPLNAVVANMQDLARGELRTAASQQVSKSVTARGDELGVLGKALLAVEVYLEGAAQTASQVAGGNLAVRFTPQSEHDLLGTSLQQMVQNLNALAGEVVSSSQHVGSASHQLLSSADQANMGSQEIASAIQQVTAGINQQNNELSQALSAIEQTADMIQRVAQGAQDQQQAVVLENQIAGRMNAAILDTSQNIRGVVQVSQASSTKANEGASTIRQAINSMESIRSQMATLVEKVNGMSAHSNQINAIVETIEDIALKTNILSINATIEAAHAKTQVKGLTENMLNQMMTAQCQMIAHLLSLKDNIREQSFWKELSVSTALDSIVISDAGGVVVYSDNAARIGWRFPDDPKSPSFPFLKLIGQKNGVVCQPVQMNTADKKLYKFVGISRTDQPGIIQVGFNTDSLKKFDVRTEGFAVVAEEVYKLSEQSQTATREIRRLNLGIQSSIRESQAAMEASLRNVDSSKLQTDAAGQVLAIILSSVQDVYQQAENVLASTHQMGELAERLSAAVTSVSKVAEQNASDSQSMHNRYTLIAQTMQRISALSQQNSATADEVSHSTLDMQDQIERVKGSAYSLTGLAQNLGQVVTQFTLN